MSVTRCEKIALVIAASLVVTPLAVQPAKKLIQYYWNKPDDNPSPSNVIGALTFGAICLQAWVANRQRQIMTEQNKLIDLQRSTLSNMERAYVFVGRDIIVSTPNRTYWKGSWVDFKLTNHGRTPAVVEEIHTASRYVECGWPDHEWTFQKDVRSAIIVGPGDSYGPIGAPIYLRSGEIDAAMAEKGKILFWGKIIYRDVFNVIRETSFCKEYSFRESAFRLANCPQLNYYT